MKRHLTLIEAKFLQNISSHLKYQDVHESEKHNAKTVHGFNNQIIKESECNAKVSNVKRGFGQIILELTVFTATFLLQKQLANVAVNRKKAMPYF